jgi:RNA polymerase sigma factor (sigma-70 family)
MSSGPAHSQLTDEDLVSLCLRGERKAWESLILRYERLIWAVARRSGLSEPDCADVFQHTCVKLLEKLDTLRDRRCLAAWLVSTAGRQCREVRRKHKVREVAARRLTAEPPPESSLPHEELAELEEKAMLRAALDRLSPRCRRIVELTFLSRSRRSYAEIAEELGIPEGSIGPTRMRCVEKLRMILRDLGVDA